MYSIKNSSETGDKIIINSRCTFHFIYFSLKSKYLQMRLPKLKLHWQILISLVLAVLYGVFLTDYVYLVGWIGELFLKALKMVIIPLILSSIISGVTSLGSGNNLGRLGLKTFTYYISTSLLAILTGLFLVNLIAPGKGMNMTVTGQQDIALQSLSLKEVILNIVPDNIFAAMSQGNMLPIIFFAIIAGFFITQMTSQPQKILSDFFTAVFDLMMKITLFIIKFTPLGVFGLLAKEVARNIDSLSQLAGNMGIYMLTVFLALTIHACLSLPAIVRFIGKANPAKHAKNMISPLFTAFSTASSSATLPLTIEAVENKSGVSNKISSFTLPLGATINMDGTALYECVAAIFIANAYGIELSLMQQVLIVITALVTSIGAAGIPMAGLVMITVILTAVGLPLEGVGLILAVDLPLDMLRTTTNVWSDSCGAVVIAKSEGEQTLV